MYSNWTLKFYKNGEEIAEEFIKELSWSTLMMALGIKRRDNYITKSIRGQFDNVSIYEWKKGKKELIREHMETF